MPIAILAAASIYLYPEGLIPLLAGTGISFFIALLTGRKLVNPISGAAALTAGLCLSLLFYSGTIDLLVSQSKWQMLPGAFGQGVWRYFDQFYAGASGHEHAVPQSFLLSAPLAGSGPSTP